MNMKKILFLGLLLLLGCADENALEKQIAAIPLELDIVRFDQIFLRSSPDDLPKLKETFPVFFPSSVPDSTWIYTMNDPLQKQLQSEIDSVFTDFAPVQRAITSVLQHISFYFPSYKLPEVYTVTSEDYRKNIILYQDMIFIALNVYLGKDLPKMHIPTGIIWGKNDTVTPPNVAEEFHELLPDSNLYWIDKCGHAPMMEHPEEFNKCLEDWLTKRNLH